MSHSPRNSITAAWVELKRRGIRHPNFDDYITLKVEARYRDLASLTEILRTFGSLEAAIEAIGGTIASSGRSPIPDAHIDDDLSFALEVARYDGKTGVSIPDYSAFRKQLSNQGAQRLVSADTIIKRHGTWNTAIEAMGGQVIRECDIPDAQIDDDLRFALEVARYDGKTSVTKDDYSALREQLRNQGAQRLVSADTIIKRHGTWNTAIEAIGGTIASSGRSPIPDAHIDDDLRFALEVARYDGKTSVTKDDYSALREQLRNQGAQRLVSANTIIKRHGTWNTAIEAIGGTIFCERTLSKL